MGHGITGHLLHIGVGRYTAAVADAHSTEVAILERHGEEATPGNTIVFQRDDQHAMAGAVAEESSDETLMKSWVAVATSYDCSGRSAQLTRIEVIILISPSLHSLPRPVRSSTGKAVVLFATSKPPGQPKGTDSLSQCCP